VNAEHLGQIGLFATGDARFAVGGAGKQPEQSEIQMRQPLIGRCPIDIRQFSRGELGVAHPAWPS